MRWSSRLNGDVVAVFDLATGARVPLRASVPADAARHGAPDTIVMAWPRARLEYGHTYLARVTDGVRAHTGGSAPRATAIERAVVAGWLPLGDAIAAADLLGLPPSPEARPSNSATSASSN